MPVQVDKTQAKQPFQVTRAKCGQCGKELRYVPFSLNNIMCRDCYGLDRYRRNAPSVVASEKPVAIAMSGTNALGATGIGSTSTVDADAAPEMEVAPDAADEDAAPLA